MTTPAVELRERPEPAGPRPVLVWAPGPGWRSVSSAIVGGGLGPTTWWLNAGVDKEYFHPDPVAHVHGIAAGLGLRGPGVGMLTAADVTRRTAATDGGVHAVATVGLGLPVFAAVPAERALAETSASARAVGLRVGTINVLVVVPVPLSDAALVNAVVTATEAKAQALAEAGVPGTGTSSDAVCIACPSTVDGGPPPEPYGGPRSPYGARLARAVHAAIAEGTRDWLRDHPPVRG